MQKKTRNDNEKAYLKAYDELSDTLFRHSFFRVSSREVALDIVQDAFLKTWQHMEEGNEILNLKSFLYRVVNNLIIDHYRKSKSDSLDKLTEDGFDPSDAAHEHIAINAEVQLALRAMEGLSSEDRDVIVMRHIDGMTVKDIAERLGETENVVSVRLHRAIKRAQELIEPPQ